jgi:hypothetical protein
MRPAQDYRDKAARAERLANDPRQQPELRAELRAIARQWRHRAEQVDWFARGVRPEEQIRRDRV